MASGPPEISSDNKQITVHLREGVKFSPPVNREVTAEDVAYAFQRATNPNVANPYIGAYFKSIEGEPQAEKEGGAKPIKGITTPNKHTIVFKLTEPKAQFVAAALVMPISAAGAEGIRRKISTRTSRRTTPRSRSRPART